MKEYIAPVISVVQFKVDERIAICNGRCDHDMVGDDGVQYYALQYS